MSTLGPNAQLALDTIHRKPVKGIPAWLIHPMEHLIIDRVADAPPGSYRRDPEPIYLAMQKAAGCCFLDQYIPTNPLSIGNHGYEGTSPRGATTGADTIIVDNFTIGSPEAVAEYLENIAFPKLIRAAAEFDENAAVKAILERETREQEILGTDILKTGYGFIRFPCMSYSHFGYMNYFMAYALFPELIERHFSLQADLSIMQNRAVARAYAEGRLPPLYRLDHDMADSRGTLVDIKSLDRIWFPHFARCIKPLVDAGVTLIWHCDGNLMQMLPRLIDCGIGGFQGFQYEDGMDYETICGWKTRDGRELFIIAGVSVTRTLPLGTPDDVRREMRRLVDHGPRTGLALGASSSIAPGVPWENIRAMVEGFQYYREHGRS